MHEPGRDGADPTVDCLQSRKKLPGSEVAEGIAALELDKVQGHCAGLFRVGTAPGGAIRDNP
jgi:hypothetical protein